jgi:hypothetical protein
VIQLLSLWEIKDYNQALTVFGGLKDKPLSVSASELQGTDAGTLQKAEL